MKPSIFEEALDIRRDIREKIRTGPAASEDEIATVLSSRGIARCEPYRLFMSTVGPISYGEEDVFYSCEQALSETQSIAASSGDQYRDLYSSTRWLCIAWVSIGYCFFIRDASEQFPCGTVFMTTFEKPLSKALIAASSPIALSKLMAKKYEYYVKHSLWELQEDESIVSEPEGIWPFPKISTGKEPAFSVDPGLRELDARYPKLSCFHELNAL